MYCIVGCSTDSTDDESIFPTPPIIAKEKQETATPEIQVAVVNPPVPEPIVADKAGNWDPGGIITFVTRAKE